MAIEQIIQSTSNGYVVSGYATLVSSSDPDLASIAIKTGLTTVVSAVASFAEAPGSAASIYASISGGTVTFYGGNVDSINVYYVITGV
jgi:hypothetical protein